MKAGSGRGRAADGRRHYVERTWAPPWVFALVWGACLFGGTMGAWGVLSGERLEPGLSAGELAAVASLGLMVVLPSLFTAIFACLDVAVRGDRIDIAFGPVHVIRKRIMFSDIEDVRGITYRPLMEFGGWGIRWRPGKTAWSIRGAQALAVTLRSGRQIYVGTRHPQRLAGAVRTAMRMEGRG